MKTIHCKWRPDIKMLTIRRARETDLDPCLILLRTPELRHASGVYMKKQWLVKYIGNEFLVAERNNKLIGMIYGEILRDNGSLIWGIAVDKKYRGKGIAGQLLDEYEKRVRKKQVEWIILYGNLSSKAAQRLYLHRGYDKGLCHFEYVKEIKTI